MNALLEYFAGITPASKLCKNCKWCKISFANRVLLGWEGAICTSPNRTKINDFIDVVTGETVAQGKLNLCVANRFLDCGPEARYYEERGAKDLAKIV